MAAGSGALRTRVLWYLFLAVFGTFHAEVFSASSPWVLVSPPHFALVVPVYAIHYIVLGELLLRFRRNDWRALYAAGLLVGMYETWITKVYWNPPWSSAGPGSLGLAWVEVLWIGFTWHAIVSFLIPMRLAAVWMSPRPGPTTFASLSVPDRVLLFGTPALFVLTVTFGDPATGFGSIAASLVVIAVVGLAFRWSAQRSGMRSLLDLRMSDRGFAAWILVLISLYAAYYVLLRPEAIPAPDVQWGTFVLDLALVALLLAVLRWGPTPRDPPEGSVDRALFSPGRFLVYAGYFLAVVAVVLGLHALAAPVVVAAATAFVLVGIGLPVVLIAWLVRDVVRRIRPRRAPAPAPP